MDCFQILNIHATNDISTIKKAYALLLKSHSPETDPTGFQRLRTAYEEALQRAEQGEGLEQESGSEVEDFMVAFVSTYHHYEERINPNSWQELLERDVCFHLDTSQEVSHKILEFIMEHYYFPYEIWSLFERHFSWSTQKDHLYDFFPRNFIDFVAYRVEHDDNFNYEALTSAVPNQQDQFIKEYRDGCRHLDEYNLYQTKQHISMAESICPKHPDLLILTARYLMTCGQLDESLTLLTRVIAEHMASKNAFLHRGHLYFRMGKMKEAYHDYKIAFTNQSGSVELLWSLGKCCKNLGKYEEAITYFKLVEKQLPQDQEVHTALHSTYCFQVDQLLEQSQDNKTDRKLQYQLAEALFSSRRLDEAYDLLQQLEDNQETDRDTTLLFCQVLLTLGKKELAETTINKALLLYPHDEEIFFYKALILEEFGKLDESLNYYELALELNPENPTLYNNKAYLLNKLNQHQGALETIDQAIQLDPNLNQAYKNKAEALLGLQLYEEGFAACREALSRDRYFTDVYVIKMKLFYQVRKYTDALFWYEKAQELGLRDSRLDSEKAKVLYQLDQYDEAIFHCKQALEQEEKNEDGYYYKALCLLELTRQEEALVEIDQAIDAGVQPIDMFFKLKGDIYYNERRYEEAIACYDKVIKLDPDRVEIYNSKGDAHYKLQEFEQVIEQCDLVLARYPDNLTALINKASALNDLKEREKGIIICDQGLVYHEQQPNLLYIKSLILSEPGSHEEALVILEEVIHSEQNKENLWDRLYFLKGWNLSELGRHEEAIEAFKIALQYDSEHAHYYSRTGYEYLYMDQYDEAMHYCEQSLALDPQYSYTWALKGDIFTELDNIEEALVAYERAIEIDPNYVHCYHYTGFLLNKLEKYEEAIPYFDKALKIDPSYENLYISKSYSYFKLGLYEQCLEQCYLVLELYPDSADGHHNAAEALYYLGKIKEAEKHCDYALSLMEDSEELRELKQKITNKSKIKKITNFFIKR